jgi:plastocyanin
LVIFALIFAACGASAPAAAPPTDPPAPQPTSGTAAVPTPTFEPASDAGAEPTVGAEPTLGAAPSAAGGALAWRDQVLRNDQVNITISGLPAPQPGQVYTAWLGGKDGSVPVGTLSAGADQATLTFVSPSNDNLLGKFNQIYIAQAAQPEAQTNNQNVLLSGALPELALVHIRHVLFSIGSTPNKIGFALGLRQETDELQRHAQFLKDAFDAGDFALVKVHAEHLINIIDGSQARDVNGDGKVQNPGDGFGLLQNGNQDGYIKGMIDHAGLAAGAPDATPAIKLHAGHVEIAGENTRVRVQDIHDRAVAIAAAGGISDVQQDVLKILALAQQVIQGVDANLDEQIGPVPGEGGVLTAYQHAQLMAGVPLAPGQASAPAPLPAGQPAPTAQAIKIAIADNSFAPSKLTVPVGATVVWEQHGQRPHTVTADDGSFDSGKLDAGGSFSETFAKPGTYAYFCTFHGGKGGEGMAATIVVADQSSTSAPPSHVQPTPAPAQPTPAPAQPTAQPAAAPAQLTVAMKDFDFAPKQIKVKAGTTVIWRNDGLKPHSATAADSSFDTALLQAGESKSVRFDTPGTFGYYCTLHGTPDGNGMVGTLEVEP